MSRPSASCFLVVSESPDLSDSVVAGPYEASPADNRMTKMRITGLDPSTEYYYAVASDGRIDLPGRHWIINDTCNPTIFIQNDGGLMFTNG